MIVRALLLADAVDAGIAGKVFIHGGGIRRMSGDEFPWTLPMAAVYAQLEAEDEPPGSDHSVAVRFVGPDHEPIGVELSTNVRLAASDIEGMPSTINFAVAFAGIVFELAGIHRVELLLGDEKVAETKFFVEALGRSD